MIQINDLCDYINKQLNMLLAGNSEYKSDFVFEFYPDSGNYTPPTYEANSNKVKKRVLGIVEVDGSSIVPTSNGLRIATQTLLINFAIKIQKDLGVEDSVREPIKAISDFMSEARNFESSAWFEGYDKNYIVAMYGTQPTPGERVQHPQLGDSMTYSFSINFSFVENGICSKDEELYYEYSVEQNGELVGRREQIQYISMNIVRSPLSDGSPFSNTNGNSVMWHNGSTLEIHLSMAATTNSEFVKEFYNYIRTGEEKILEIKYHNKFNTYPGNLYLMHFGESNLTSRGVENVGISIKLVQALVEEADAFEEE